MKHPIVNVGWVAAGLILFGLSWNSSAFGQGRVSVGDYYGSGPEGTIGRGTNRLPGGPSDWNRGRGRSPSYGQLYGLPGSGSDRFSNRGTTSPNSFYYYNPSRLSSPAVTQGSYLTNLHYEPGDGYRYPLYYTPATRTYYYYPVRKG